MLRSSVIIAYLKFSTSKHNEQSELITRSYIIHTSKGSTNNNKLLLNIVKDTWMKAIIKKVLEYGVTMKNKNCKRQQSHTQQGSKYVKETHKWLTRWRSNAALRRDRHHPRWELNRIQNINSHPRTGRGILKGTHSYFRRGTQKKSVAKNYEVTASVSMLFSPFKRQQKLKGSKCCVYAM